MIVTVLRCYYFVIDRRWCSDDSTVIPIPRFIHYDLRLPFVVRSTLFDPVVVDVVTLRSVVTVLLHVVHILPVLPTATLPHSLPTYLPVSLHLCAVVR